MKKILKSWPFKNTTCVLWARTWLVNRIEILKKISTQGEKWCIVIDTIVMGHVLIVY